MMVRLPPFFELVALDSVDSTNDEAKRRAEAGAPPQTVVWSKTQNSGRGRRGRAWVSEPGNLYCSLILRPKCPAPEAVQLTFVSALAVVETVERFAPKAEVRCKWPNDVLLNGRKVAGILLEGNPEWVVVGTGINVAHFPDETAFPATSLAAEGAAATVQETLEAFCQCFRKRAEVWRKQGFAPIRAAWLERAAGLGQPVTARLAKQTLQGTFADLDQDGALILETADGRQRITAGDVFPVTH